MQAVKEIVQKYIKAVGRPAEAHRLINEGLDEDLRITAQTVYFWYEGDYKPSPRVLKIIRFSYPVDDWRHKMAAELLDAYRVEAAALTAQREGE